MAATSVLLEATPKRPWTRRIASLHPNMQLLKVGHHERHVQPRRNSGDHETKFRRDLCRLSHILRSAQTRRPRPLHAAGIHVYRTDLDGAVTFYLDATLNRITPAQTDKRVENQYVENRNESPGRARFSRAVTAQNKTGL